MLRLGHANHRGVQGRSTPPQADRDASRHQDRYVVSSRSILRRRIIERSRRFRAGHGQARLSLYPAKPAKFKSASSSRCQASQATSPTPRRLTITPPATPGQRPRQPAPRRNPHSRARQRRNPLPRVPSLKAFRRRPPCSPHLLDGPSSETLHKSRLSRCKKFGRPARHGAPNAIGCRSDRGRSRPRRKTTLLL